MRTSIPVSEVKKIVFACDAGMGSSLIGANLLKKKVKSANLPVEVHHTPVRSIPQDAQVVLVHKGLAKRAVEVAPWTVIVAIDNFLNNPVYDELVHNLGNGSKITTTML